MSGFFDELQRRQAELLLNLAKIKELKVIGRTFLWPDSDYSGMASHGPVWDQIRNDPRFQELAGEKKP